MLRSALAALLLTAALPAAAKRYVERLSELAGVPIDIISTGADREETIVLRHPFR